MYADDLVIITDTNNIEKLLDILFLKATLFNLKINIKKSSILAIKGN